MLTIEKLIQVLHAGKQYCRHDIVTDEAGLAYFWDCSTRKVQEWRAIEKGPRAFRSNRWVYYLEDIVAWENAQVAGGENHSKELANCGTGVRKGGNS